MQPNSEPTPADIAAVAAFNAGQPAPQAPAPQPTPEPAQPAPQQQPAQPTPQPAPTQQPTDPFASLFASEPAAPTTPTEPAPAPTEPTQPTEPVPTPQPQQPTEPSQPTPPQPQNNGDDYESYESYMGRVLQGIPSEDPQMPDPEKINPEDPNAIKGFFDDLINTAVQRANTNVARKSAIQAAEKAAWDSAFEKFPTLQKNKELRDTVHNIRIANFQRGVVMSPTQAAEKLLASMGQQYRQGVADQQVVTTYENVQPNGGGTGAPVPTTTDAKAALEQLQTGGETALAAMLDAEIKAGRL